MSSFLPLDIHLQLDMRKDLGIGIIGAGAIVAFAHLPAYRQAGFRVVGLFDAQKEKAQKLAGEFGVTKTYASEEELFADPSVAIVDIAVPAKFQPPLAKKAIRAGKHLLCQKPLAESYPEALEIVVAAEERGLRLAVNQQMRWEPAIRAAHQLVSRGWLGTPTQFTLETNVLTDWSAWPWLVVSPWLEVMYHSIHYLDSMRFLLGMPARLYALAGRYPGQKETGETRTTMVFEYENGVMGLIADNHNNWTNDRYARFRLEGTEGLIKGTLGLLQDYPRGGPDTLEFTSRRHSPGYHFSTRLEGTWIPDAFMGTMGELIQSIEQKREPQTSGRDNLQTLQLVFAAYRSMEEKRAVAPAEIAQPSPK